MSEGRISQALWTAEDAAEATGGRLIGADSWIATGVSIDTRTLEPGDLFVALKDVRDGHDFRSPSVCNAARGAALVSRVDSGRLGRASSSAMCSKACASSAKPRAIAAPPSASP